MASSNRQRTCDDYHVAWICAVADLELLPARLMLDDELPTPPYDTHYDENTYICGSINGHAVVVATCPPGETGNVNAGRLTGSMFKTFRNIRMAVLVGIGGGIPSLEVSKESLKNIHLGDVVVGWPGDGKPACVYHDRGRSKVDGQFELVGTMQNPDWRLISALGVLASDHELGKTTFANQLARLQRHKERFAYPGAKHDRLYKAAYHHNGSSTSKCATCCDQSELVKRPRRTKKDQQTLVFHCGRIATGNAVIKDGELRDQIRARCDGVLCVEMEAAGVDANRRCLVVRGISDYADSHKSDLWQSYAAGNAAAFTRELLCRVQPDTVNETEAIRSAQDYGFMQANYTHGVLLTPQGQANGLSQQSNGPHHASLGQGMQSPDTAQKAESHSSPKISVKSFQNLRLKEGPMLGDAAGRIISKLTGILKSTSVQQDHSLSVQSDRGMDTLEGYNSISPQDLKRLRNILKSSYSVGVNGNAAKFETDGDRSLTQKRSMQVVNIQGHEITVMLLERTAAHTPHGPGWQAARDRGTEVIAKVRIAQTSRERAVVTAYIHYIQGPNTLLTMNPIISVGKILPLDSPVFHIVLDGDVNSLRHLLREHRCTLRDRDSNGTPLLHYAMEQPEMCKFLVENGADIDELATDYHYPEYQCTPLSQMWNNWEIGDDEEMQRIEECRRILLANHADATLPASDGYILLETVVSGSALDTMIHVLDTSRLFINMNERDSTGRTLLLLLAENISGGYNADKFAALLDRGADIHSRNADGNTCLHEAVMNPWHIANMESQVHAIMLLIARGANIFTLNNHGRSIFDDAYECDHKWSNLGSYRGDLWDHVLIRCGYGKHIRSPEKRIYHYTEDYTEDNFRSLWEGWEHLFPYSRETSTPCSGLMSEDEYEDDYDDEDDEDDDEDEDEDDDDEDNEDWDGDESNDEGRRPAEEDEDED